MLKKIVMIISILFLTNSFANILKSPDQLAQHYAEAIQSGDGKVQYKLFCPLLQKQYLDLYLKRNWNTNNPGSVITHYKITKASRGKHPRYSINFYKSYHSRPIGYFTDEIILLPLNLNQQTYCIQTVLRMPHFLGSG